MSTYDLQGVRHVVFVCTGADCREAGALDVAAELKSEIKACRLGAEVQLVRTRCMGRCADGCNVVVTPSTDWYGGVSPKTAKQIVREQLRDGTPVTRALSYRMEGGHLVPSSSAKRGKKKS